MANDERFINRLKKLIRRYSITVPDGYETVSASDSLKNLTAVFVGDVEPQKEYHSSTMRYVGRIGVTFSTLLAFAAIAAFLFTREVPSSRTVRHWATLSDGQQNIFNFTSSDEEKFKNDTNQICFCRKTNINWPDYVAFFPLTNMSHDDGNTKSTSFIKGPNITSREAFCNNTILESSSLAMNACLIMVEAIVAPNISQTCLESATLTGPSLLNDTISNRVRGGLDQILWDYKILLSLKNAQEYDLISALYLLWTTMLDQFVSSQQSSYKDYWVAAKNNNVLRVMKGNESALGMEVFWYKYANRCNPPFCDVVVQNSWQYRAFQVIAQVGGISSLVLLFVRMFLWPALRHLFGWPLLYRTENTQLQNQLIQPAPASSFKKIRKS